MMSIVRYQILFVELGRQASSSTYHFQAGLHLSRTVAQPQPPVLKLSSGDPVLLKNTLPVECVQVGEILEE